MVFLSTRFTILEYGSSSDDTCNAMRYTHVRLDSLGYELAPNVVTSAAREERLAPIYDALRLPSGQIAALTGVRERRLHLSEALLGFLQLLFNRGRKHDSSVSRRTTALMALLRRPAFKQEGLPATDQGRS